MTPAQIQKVRDRCRPIQGWMEDVELLWLANEAITKKTIIEVGSWKGRSTAALTCHSAAIVYCVDHWWGSDDGGKTKGEVLERGGRWVSGEFNRNLAREIASTQVRTMAMHSFKAVDLLKSWDVMSDMVFIDADHEYGPTVQHLKKFAPLVRKGGLMCGHDYSASWPGVKRAVDQLYPKAEHPAGSIWTVKL